MTRGRLGNHRLHALTIFLRVDDEQHILSPEVRAEIIAFLQDKTRLLVAHQHVDGYWDGRWPLENASSDDKQNVSGDAITLTLRNETDAGRSAEIAARLDGADKPGVDANVVRLHVPDGARALPVLLGELTKAGIDAIGVDVNRPTLDDVFLTLTGRSLRD